MGAASADLPAIVVSAGPMLNGRWKGQDLGACTDCRRYWAEYRAGVIDQKAVAELEDALCRSAGTCMVMGTASTMASVTEALGMALPGNAAIPAVDSRRLRLAELSGRRAVELARDRGPRPSQIMTRPVFENAIRIIAAVGGSTNAVVHLIAIAGRLGIELPLDLFDELSRSTPLLLNARPSGRYQMEEIHEAGGIPVLMKELAPLLHLDCLTVTGQTQRQNLAAIKRDDPSREVVASLDEPFEPEGGLAILRGNLAPDGAVIKHSAASKERLKHRGRAVVFTSIQDLSARVDEPGLEIEPEDVMVLQNAGPVGAPGMPEAGLLPIPRKLLGRGVRDMVRISDARMSGTAFGTIVLHVAPEAAVGGPLGLVRDGDWIELDVPSRRLELLVPAEELARRHVGWRPPPKRYDRGYRRLYADHVLQADRGCDFDFLVGRVGTPA
jgi:dihydroxy-acid dehydratase